MKRLRGVLGLFLIIAGLAGSAFTQTPNITIQLISTQYNLSANTTAVVYRVSSNGPYALSHWDLEWCSEASIISSNPPYTEFNTDPKTGITGIKWETDYWEDIYTKDFTIVFEGIWPIGTTQAGIKTKNVEVRNIAGPVCEGGASGKIGDRVWADVDRDGQQDSGENGIQGVQVRLYLENGTLIGTLTTGSNGIYTFNNLAAGSYYVDVVNGTVPAGYALTTNNDPTSVINLASGQIYLDADFGYAVPPAPGLRLKKYTNNEDADEITGPVVNVGSTVTWKYVVENTGNVALTNILVTDDKVGTIGTIPSLAVGEKDSLTKTGTALEGQYANMGTASTTYEETPVSSTDPSHYLGVVPPAPGLRLKKYTNNEDADEITGPVVNVGSAVTWKYVVENTGNVALTNILVTDDKVGTIGTIPTLAVGAKDSLTKTGTALEGQYANMGTASTTYEETPVSSTDPSHYLGVPNYPRLGSIGDRVWLDINDNGIQDQNEAGVENVRVILLSAGRSPDAIPTSKSTKRSILSFPGLQPVDTLYTDASGHYRFMDLTAGTYRLHFGCPTGFIYAWMDQGSQDAADSDADPSAGYSANIVLAEGEHLNVWDTGLLPLSSVSDFVWNDSNENGIQDSNEAGIQGVTVTLYKDADKDGKAEPDGEDGAQLMSVQTGANGLYHFEGLRLGAYFLQFTPPANYHFTVENQGSDPNADSNADPATGLTEVFMLTAGQNDATWDVGLIHSAPPTGSIGDYVWNDSNRDGRQDPSESAIEGVTLRLLNPAGGVIGTTITDPAGIYNFTGLPAGRYTVDVDESTLPAGFALTTANEPHSVTLGSGEKYELADFGYAPVPNPVSGSIGDYVWKDTDRDGVQDDEEFGIPEITVLLLDSLKRVIGRDTTDADGYYMFKKIPPGLYFVDADESDPEMPDGVFLTTRKDTISVLLNEDEQYLDADFGYGDNVWGRGRRELLARYQPWYGDSKTDSSMRHWSPEYRGGQADTSLIGTYGSFDASVLEYHILLAWASGIDGFVVDWYGKGTYENDGLMKMLDAAELLNEKFRNNGFRFEIAASYNESSAGRLDTNLAVIGRSVLSHPAYWGNGRNVRRPLFLFNREEAVLQPSEYRACADTLLPPDVFLVWNGTEPESFKPMDASYPWVQPLNGEWDPEGRNWGATYLDTAYTRMNTLPEPGDLMFAVGGVWPGFDDRPYSLGRGHWMDRQDTLVYDRTWAKVLEYDRSLPMPWCLIETWNDFNEATRVEPDQGADYRFVRMTRDRARLFKGSIPPDSTGVDDLGLLVPQHIYQARIAAMLRPSEAAEINKGIENAFKAFFERNSLGAISFADRAAGLAPRDVFVQAVSDTAIELAWKPASHAGGYMVSLSLNSGDFAPCGPNPLLRLWAGSGTEFRIGGLMPGLEYNISVTGVDSSLGMFANGSWHENAYNAVRILVQQTVGEQFLSKRAPLEDSPDAGDSVPKSFTLYANYPNPFNPVTTIQFDLPEDQHVLLKVYDIRGREVETLVDEYRTAGRYKTLFDAHGLASGIYLYRIATEKYAAVKRLTLLR